MNIAHLIAIIKLRWRMTYNQWKKAGRTNAIVTGIFAGLAILSAVMGFFVTVFAGNYFFGEFKPNALMFTFDVMVGLFLFAWVISLMAEIQRSELLSLENLLHLPVSLSGAFLLNYLSSWVCLSILFLAPLLLGMCIALPMTHGPTMLTVGPLAIGFLVMVTGVTYQLRGWLCRLMQNKRTRGTVIVGLTIGMVTLCQVPQLLNMMNSRKKSDDRREWTAIADRQREELADRLNSEGVDAAEAEKQLNELELSQLEEQLQRQTNEFQELTEVAVVANKVLPPGWFPLGVRSAAQGSVALPLLCSLGMLMIGGCSLVMSYRSTLRTYTRAPSGHITAVHSADATAAPSSDSTAMPPTSDTSAGLLEKTIPLTSTQTSIIALSSFRSLIRAPETKAALITPLIFVVMFGGMGITRDLNVLPIRFRPLAALGIFSMTMFGLVQFSMNMFGLDRSGFKSYIMMPVERWRVLFGKNLSLLPMFLAMGIVLLCIMQFLMPMFAHHVAASVLQLISVSMSFLVIGNFVSTVSPVAMSYGSMKPAKPKLSAMLLQAVCAFASPLLCLPSLAAFGIEFCVHEWLGWQRLPVYLILSIVQLAVVAWIYSRVIRVQGRFLQKREQRVLEVVVSKNE